ncbi:uncharacterized protein B0H18DRAFT_1005272 [Fomitopsis serialis]|uniref:uncharacterized protein n=1 Tax=Fomitopsis serialis TaxID=139415 RepID=UPI00200748B7|nr:uncharacterized protein B0H18DRAFT_1005272 [Neoantrodia serialis]KAH9926726.1 hypothetical protein B0H18DRAFT_1005272 [Neoantrodia serialis]
MYVRTTATHTKPSKPQPEKAKSGSRDRCSAHAQNFVMTRMLYRPLSGHTYGPSHR